MNIYKIYTLESLQKKGIFHFLVLFKKKSNMGMEELRSKDGVGGGGVSKSKVMSSLGQVVKGVRV